jgi:hypothetical protein
MARAERTIHQAGLRVAATTTIGAAAERLGQQARTAAVWLELDCDCGGAMDGLLAAMSRDASEGRYAAIVSMTPSLVDTVSALVGSNPVELVVDGSEADRLAAMTIAMAQKDFALRLSDVAGDKNAERLRQLSDEMNRIASTLARLSSGPAGLSPALAPASPAEAPPLSADTVRNVIRARRLRARYFRKSCSPIRHGTGSSICCRPRSRTCGCRYPVYVSLPPFQRRQHCAG